jgi:hypothetical protein
VIGELLRLIPSKLSPSGDSSSQVDSRGEGDSRRNRRGPLEPFVSYHSSGSEDPRDLKQREERDEVRKGQRG